MNATGRRLAERSMPAKSQFSQISHEGSWHGRRIVLVSRCERTARTAIGSADHLAVGDCNGIRRSGRRADAYGMARSLRARGWFAAGSVRSTTTCSGTHW